MRSSPDGATGSNVRVVLPDGVSCFDRDTAQRPVEGDEVPYFDPSASRTVDRGRDITTRSPCTADADMSTHIDHDVSQLAPSGSDAPDLDAGIDTDIGTDSPSWRQRRSELSDRTRRILAPLWKDWRLGTGNAATGANPSSTPPSSGPVRW
jgi:hypothetical protein